MVEAVHGLSSATAAAFFGVACSSSDRSGLEKVGPYPDAPTITTVAAPDYTVKGGENPSTPTVLVGSEHSKVEMVAIIEDVVGDDGVELAVHVVVRRW